MRGHAPHAGAAGSPAGPRERARSGSACRRGARAARRSVHPGAAEGRGAASRLPMALVSGGLRGYPGLPNPDSMRSSWMDVGMAGIARTPVALTTADSRRAAGRAQDGSAARRMPAMAPVLEGVARATAAGTSGTDRRTRWDPGAPRHCRGAGRAGEADGGAPPPAADTDPGRRLARPSRWAPCCPRGRSRFVRAPPDAVRRGRRGCLRPRPRPARHARRPPCPGSAPSSGLPHRQPACRCRRCR